MQLISLFIAPFKSMKIVKTNTVHNFLKDAQKLIDKNGQS